MKNPLRVIVFGAVVVGALAGATACAHQAAAPPTPPAATTAATSDATAEAVKDAASGVAYSLVEYADLAEFAADSAAVFLGTVTEVDPTLSFSSSEVTDEAGMARAWLVIDRVVSGDFAVGAKVAIRLPVADETGVALWSRALPVGTRMAVYLPDSPFTDDPAGSPTPWVAVEVDGGKVMWPWLTEPLPGGIENALPGGSADPFAAA